MKRCSKCGNEFPATSEYFTNHKRNKNGLGPVCRVCVSRQGKQQRMANPDYYHLYREANKEAIAERKRLYNIENAERARQYREANKEAIKKRMECWRTNNKESLTEYSKAYCESHKEEARAYYAANKETIAVNGKAYRDAHKQEIAERLKRWYSDNSERELIRSKKWYKDNLNKRRLPEENGARIILTR